jgi:hypothetical protein
MASKKEMIAELVSLGVDEAEIKGLKNTELEALLVNIKAESALTDEATVEEPVQESAAERPKEERSAERKVVRETSHQMGIYSDYIYNVRNRNATVVIENLGYGDIYYSEDDLAVVGKSKRLIFGQTAELEGVEKICFVSASQPVLQILEVL